MIGTPVGVNRSRHDWSATTIAGCATAIIASNSARPFRGLSGTHTFPAAYVARRASRCSGVFRAQMPMRLPGRGSIDCNALANAWTRATNSR